jgi:hypothetical protein
MSSVFKYAVTNLINVDTLVEVSSEHAIYTMDKLYNVRPSYPFRFAGVGSAGNPEYICVEFPAPKKITFAGLFNHNLIRNHGSDELSIKGCISGCTSGGCNWDAPDYELSLLDRIIPNHRNSYSKLAEKYLAWRFDFINSRNPDGYIEVGDAFLGNWQKFSSNVRLQPGRPDGPSFNMGNQQSHYGQDWTNYRSETEQLFTMTFLNAGDPAVVDEIKVFFSLVQQQGGQFIVIPDDGQPFCYYVVIMNFDSLATRMQYGFTGELREWTLTLKTLVEGISLLG